MTVTLKPKCYVFVCVGCDRLALSERSDTLTCSGKCRVRAHRNGSIETLRKYAATWDVRPGSIQRAAAIRRLRPDLSKEIEAGRLTLDDTRAPVLKAFWSIVEAQSQSSRPLDESGA